MNKRFTWQDFTADLSKEIPNEKYRVWIEPLQFIKITDKSLVLGATKEIFIDFISQYYIPVFKDVLQKQYGLSLDIVFEKTAADLISSDSSAMMTMPNESNNLDEQVSDSKPSFFDSFLTSKATPVQETNQYAINVSDLTAPQTIRAYAQPLNPKLTFHNFVVGASNQFAHAAAKAVAENPVRQYNPLFIYSNAGLGKTHLMHAIGNFVLSTNPRARICYLSAERFVNDLVDAIKEGKQAQFRQKYREGYDVLLMDDIQFLANKTTSQEEFFHTFNALHESNKQIVLASDKFPKDIPGLEDRIRSRFEWGLIVEIESPDIETRLAILRSKAEQDDIYLPNEVALFLATNVKNNVRELEGTLLRLGAKADLLGVEVGLDLAKEELKQYIKNPDGEMLDYDVVLQVVAKHFNLKVSDLKSKERSRRVAVPRQICMYLIRKYSKKSLPEIGLLLGGRDHTTVLHGVKAITALVESSEEIKHHIDVIQNNL